ncbi:hypothetical protein AXG93_4295s1250 [Marchantia polymorpha subsp. ruderalis]|uniref:Reverse transcriptase domain-containing protein n=1 Tax=Marchantia polymorpha subsp. ruderalis TaxID=1480154 RepID=A0A176WAK7_MARPO|nr:hypothetical protein AXG93_4295s1250 [Marchantia polymorpha subsp. ruderalis]
MRSSLPNQVQQEKAKPEDKHLHGDEKILGPHLEISTPIGGVRSKFKWNLEPSREHSAALEAKKLSMKTSAIRKREMRAAKAAARAASGLHNPGRGKSGDEGAISPTTTDDGVDQYYAKLYTAQALSTEDISTRQELMGRVEDHLKDVERSMLSALPLEKEIEDVLLSLPHNKAPGVDGISAEALKRTWPFMKDFYIRMVGTFWAEVLLAETVTGGMIRLIPKSVNKMALKDWRPLTILTKDYKIIARILAGHLQLLLQKIILPQQTGFIKGRNMLDNVLSLWVAQDAARTYKHKSMFVKLDFEKAYDRVEHNYLWDAMSKCGLGLRFITLVKGLTLGTSMAVHMEQSFQAGRLRGYKVKDMVLLDYSLFADDMGVYIDNTHSSFQELGRVLAKYEKISNILGGWELRLLSFEARAVLLQFVLQAQPTFYSSLIKLSATTSRKVEQLYRQFLWGYIKDGEAKRSLVRWDLLCRPKAEGGLGIRGLPNTNSSLMGKWIGSILDETAGTWGLALADLVKQGRARYHTDIIRKHYSLPDLILTRQPLHLAGTEIGRALMLCWRTVQADVTWEPAGVAIPRYITLRDIVGLILHKREEVETSTKQVMAHLRQLKLTQVATLWRKKEALKRTYVRGPSNERRREEGSAIHIFLHCITSATGLTSAPLRLSASWKLKGSPIHGNFTEAAPRWLSTQTSRRRRLGMDMEDAQGGARLQRQLRTSYSTAQLHNRTRNTIDKAIAQWKESSAELPRKQWLEVASILQHAIATSTVTRIERWLISTLGKLECSEGGSNVLCTERTAIGLNMTAPPVGGTVDTW